MKNSNTSDICSWPSNKVTTCPKSAASPFRSVKSETSIDLISCDYLFMSSK